jgi:hypothetical protein
VLQLQRSLRSLLGNKRVPRVGDRLPLLAVAVAIAHFHRKCDAVYASEGMERERSVKLLVAG